MNTGTYPIEGVEDIDCMRSPRIGEVMIKLVTSDIPIGQNIAVTRIHYPSDTREILGATIFVIGGFANYERFLEHETWSLSWVGSLQARSSRDASSLSLKQDMMQFGLSYDTV